MPITLVPTILGLFFWGRPATVAGHVVAVVVNPLKRTAQGPWTHVRQERFERVTPAITNLNSSGAVSRVIRRCWRMATTLHALPTDVRRRASPIRVPTLPVAKRSAPLPSTIVADDKPSGTIRCPWLDESPTATSAHHAATARSTFNECVCPQSRPIAKSAMIGTPSSKSSIDSFIRDANR